MLVFLIGFLAVIFILLALDLGVFHKKAHAIGTKEAILWTTFWIGLALLFDVFIYNAYQHHWLEIGRQGTVTTGTDAALKYLTGYIIEESLSMDNIFVIAMIFSFFHVPDMYQHRVLFWGILGALVMRGIMIMLGVVLIKKFYWMIYVFGAFLLVTAVRMLLIRQDHMEPNKNILIRLAKKIYPVTDDFIGAKFFVRYSGSRAVTPLFLVLLVVESSDVLFAIDSIPAIFAVTTDPFIIFTSNVFAILGLRSLYFALAAMMNKFRYLKKSLVFVLAYVGTKMMLSHLYPIPTVVSLGVIAGILSVGIVASLIVSSRESAKLEMIV